MKRAIWFFILGLLGCAGAPPPPAEEPKPEKVARPPAAESEIGGMNELAVERRFGELEPGVLACVAKGSERVKEIGGHVAISIRVKTDGSVRWAFLSESTLGDLETEKCIVALAEEASWPQPLGGEGLATRAFEIDAGSPPKAIAESAVKSLTRELGERVAHCKKASSDTLSATLYVKPSGRVLTYGLSASSVAATEAYACVGKILKQAQLGPVGRKVGKVTFPL